MTKSESNPPTKRKVRKTLAQKRRMPWTPVVGDETDVLELPAVIGHGHAEGAFGGALNQFIATEMMIDSPR